MSLIENYKHYINDLVASFFYDYQKRKLNILETHQEYGDGTIIYKKYGDVYSFEISQEIYDEVKKRFPDCRYMDKNEVRFVNDNENHSYIYSKPINCLDGMDYLRQYKTNFDIVDVDPYQGPMPFFPMVFNFVSSLTFLLVTSGEMHRQYRFNLEDLLAHYSIKKGHIKSIRRFFRIQIGSIIGAELIKEGIRQSLGLFPVFFHDYYNLVTGVHRIGFIIKQPINYKDKIILRKFIIKDPNLSVDVINFSNQKDNFSSPWRFGPSLSESEVKEGITSRIENHIRANAKYKIIKR